jgi:hypothetical protein
MIEELTDELTRQQGELVEKQAELAGAVVECAETRSRLQSALTEVEQARADRDRQPPQADERAVGDALVSAHRAGSKIVADARRNAESLLEAARENASIIQSEASYVMEQAEIRAVALGEQAAAEIENLQAESAQLHASIERERQVWASFLRRALAALNEAPSGQDEADSQEVSSDLEGDLRGGIRPTERTVIGPTND